jgi:nucleotide-binding universal stress UspA family protein
VSESADLIVVGSTHHGPLGRVLLGSVGERLLSGAPCAVAVAPRGYAARGQRRFGTIAIAFDGSPEALIALHAAHDLATRTGAALQALMVIENPAAIPGQFIPLPELEPLVTIERAEALQRQELAARSALDRALHELAAGNPIDHEVLVGTDPAAAILDVAGAGVDLLVLGSRAYRAVAPHASGERLCRSRAPRAVSRADHATRRSQRLMRGPINRLATRAESWSGRASVPANHRAQGRRRSSTPRGTSTARPAGAGTDCHRRPPRWRWRR